MIHADVIVFAHPDGATYVAILGDDGDWFRWPAVANGWAQRVRLTAAHGPASLAEECEELPPRLAHLALMLSGVETGAPCDA